MLYSLFIIHYEGQCSCFAIYSRNDNRDEAEILDKELNKLVKLLQPDEIVSLRFEMKELVAEIDKLRKENAQIPRLEEEVEMGKQIEAKLVKKLEELEKKLKEEVERRKENEAKMAKKLEELEKKLKKEQQETKKAIENHLKERWKKKGWRRLPRKETEWNYGKTELWNYGKTELGVAVGDGKLFAVGGRYRSYWFKSVGYLDLKKMDAGWKKLPDMNTKRSGLGVAVGDGKLFAVGGNGGSDHYKSGEHLRIVM